MWQLKLTNLILAVFLTQLPINCVSAAPPNKGAKGPAEVVTRFCELQFQGVQLSGRHPGWRELGRLIINDKEWPHERITVVSGFRVKTVRQEGSVASVEVSYDVVAQTDEELRLTHVVREEKVRFRVLRIGNNWKIPTHDDFLPHVSPHALASHICRLIDADKRANDYSRVADLERTLNEISQLRKRGIESR